MTNRAELLNEPQLPDYLIDPDKPASLAKMRDALMTRALWEEFRDAAKKAGASLHTYINELSNDEVETFRQHAYIRSLVTTSKVRALTGRVEMSVAYKIMRKNIYRSIGEFESIQAFLEDKLDPDDPQGSSTYEAKFLLELVQSLDARANKPGFADKIFSNKLVYGKLVTLIPDLHKKQRALVVAQNIFADVVKGLEVRQNKVRKERSDARVRGEKLTKYDDELKELEVKKAKAAEEHKPVAKRLQADLTANTAAALELAASSASRKMVPDLLPKAAAEHLKKQGYKPEEVSPDYRKESPENVKAKAYTVHLAQKTIFVFETNPRQSALVTKFLGEMFDVSLAELDEAIAFLSKNKKKGA